LVLVGLESFNHHLQTLPAGSKPSGAACAAINTLCIACLLDKHRARAALGCRSVQARPAAGKTALLTPQQCAVDGSCPNDRLGRERRRHFQVAAQQRAKFDPHPSQCRSPASPAPFPGVTGAVQAGCSSRSSISLLEATHKPPAPPLA
jgi:hypothetical protein